MNELLNTFKKHRMKIYSLMIFFNIIVISSLLYLNNISNRFATHNKHIVYSISNIKYLVTQSHLWLGEYINGNSDEHKRILTFLNKSKSEIKILLVGGEIKGFEYLAKYNDEKIVLQLKEINNLIGLYSDDIERRIHNYEILDKVFDKKFETLLSTLYKLEIYIDKKFKKMFNRYQNIKTIIYFSIFILILLSIILIRKFQKEIILYLKMIDKQSKELKDINSSLENKVEKQTNINLKNQEELFKQRKIIQMNELLKNIGHHWRQPLSSISTIASSVNLRLDFKNISNEEIKDEMNIITNEVQTLSKTIDYFNSTIKRDDEISIFKLEELLSKIESLIHEQLKEVGVEFIVKNDLENIQLNNSKIKLINVILSIISNTKDVLINRIIENKKIQLISELKDESTLLLKISDNAGGIEKELLDRVFEPYFTTEHQTFNKGLSMYLNYETVTNELNGILHVENTEEGALFTIELPIT